MKPTSYKTIKKRYSRKPTTRYRKRTKSLVPLIKKVARKTLNQSEEAKHYLARSDQISISTNTIYSLPIHASIAQGDSDNQRSGDKIRLETLKLNLAFKRQGDTIDPGQNCAALYRVMLIKTRLQPGTTYSITSGTFVQDDIFYFNGSNRLLDSIVDPKKCTVLMDKMYKVHQGYTSGNAWDETKVQLKIPLKTNFQFLTDSLSYGKFHNYALIVIPDRAGEINTQASRAWAGQSFHVNQDLIFKEC